MNWRIYRTQLVQLTPGRLADGQKHPILSFFRMTLINDGGDGFGGRSSRATFAGGGFSPFPWEFPLCLSGNGSDALAPPLP